MKRLFTILLLIGVFAWNIPAFSADFYTEATARTQVRMLLTENTNDFFTDTEIDNWVKEAVEDISSRALCIQISDTIALVTGTYEYATTEGSVSVADIVKVWGCIYENPNGEYIGLKRINPMQIADLPRMKNGPPVYYYHFADKIGVFPLPTSTENGELVRVYFSKQSQTIGDLPNEYQSLTFWYAASMAEKTRGNTANSDKFYQMYIDKLTSLRSELYNVPPEKIEK